MTIKKLNQQIADVLKALGSAKPRSRRHLELELQLRDLRLKQLRMEYRSAKRAA